VFYLCPTLTRLRLDALLLLMLYDTVTCNLPHWNHISILYYILAVIGYIALLELQTWKTT
jgi:hypothetical protein